MVPSLLSKISLIGKTCRKFADFFSIWRPFPIAMGNELPCFEVSDDLNSFLSFLGWSENVWIISTYTRCDLHKNSMKLLRQLAGSFIGYGTAAEKHLHKTSLQFPWICNKMLFRTKMLVMGTFSLTELKNINKKICVMFGQQDCFQIFLVMLYSLHRWIWENYLYFKVSLYFRKKIRMKSIIFYEVWLT